MTDTKIREVAFDQEFHIHIVLDNGDSIVYDMQPKLITARFQELSDSHVFLEGSIMGGKIISWSTGVELTLDEILLNICGNRE